LTSSSWTIKPWFLTEGKTCCYIHHTLLLGFPTGQSFTSLITCQQVLWHYLSPRHQQVFLAPLPRNEEVVEEEAPTSTRRQQNINKFFWHCCRGGRRLLQGEFHTHILYFVLSFAFTLFLLASFYQKPKKISILCSCYFFTLVHYVAP
jgi:hypothetical protein